MPAAAVIDATTSSPSDGRRWAWGAYENTVKEFTKAAKLDEARIVQKELESFQAGAPTGSAGSAPWDKLGGKLKLPGYFLPNPVARNEKDGVRIAGHIRTRDGTFLKQDFDSLVRTPASARNSRGRHI